MYHHIDGTRSRRTGTCGGGCKPGQGDRKRRALAEASPVDTVPAAEDRPCHQRRARVDEHEVKLKDLQKEFQQEQNNLLQKALQLAQEQQLEQNAAAKAPAPKAPKPVQPILQAPQ